MIDEQGNIKLIDFAMAEKLQSESEEIEAKEAKNISYLAPEIIRRDSGFTIASDWWAVGVIMFQLVLGYKPFKDKHSIAKDKVEFPNRDRKPHSDSFKDLIKQLLDKNPR